MSTEIKPGQVWAATADHEETYTVREVRDGDVWSTNRYGGHTVNRADLFRQGRTLLTDATPAPLDPSKVKAGDTVTLTYGKAKVEGEVHRYLDNGTLVYKDVPGLYPLVGVTAWTLTAHHPAPEPEPVWEPGTVGTAAVKGRFGRVRVMRLHECPTDKTHHWVEESGLIPDDSHVTDVRPLVVIDPATGWWADIHNALVAAGIGDAGSAATIALATLGIEATS